MDSKVCKWFYGTASQMFYRDAKKKSETQAAFDNDHSRWKSSMCPLCHMERENTKHVLICTNAKMIRFREKQIAELEQWFQTRKTDPKISRCIITCLNSNGDISFLEAMNAMSVSQDYRICANLQDQIGYHNFWFGRFATTWRDIQRDYLCANFHDRRYSADAWAKHLVSRLYRLSHKLWRYRCERVHGKDQKQTSKRERKILRKEIRSQYRLGTDTVLACHRELLSTPQKKMLKESERAQKYWIKALKASQEFFEETEKNMFVGMRDIMRRWAFQPD